MKIKIFAVGKLKKDYNKFAVEDYLERIRFYIPIEIIEVVLIYERGNSSPIWEPF